MIELNLQEVKSILESRGIAIVEERDVQDGVLIKVQSGTTITAYKTGKVLVQGKGKREIEAILAGQPEDSMLPPAKMMKLTETIEAKPSSSSDNGTSSSSSSLPTGARKKIFIVHGRDDMNRLELENFLWRHNYEPVVLKDEPDRGDTIIEKLERVFQNGQISATIVLATADDKYTDSEGAIIRRCRPNVDMELGFVIAKLTRKRMVYLKQKVNDNETFFVPSDFSGVVYTDFTKTGEIQHKILTELQHATSELV